MAGPRYIADDESCVSTIELGGLTALFHEPSGMTHIVAPPAPQILQVLRESPRNAGEIFTRIAELYEIENEAGAEAIEARLAELEEAGLVRRA